MGLKMEWSDSVLFARRISVSASATVIVISSLILAGWAAGNQHLMGSVLGSPPTQPVTAILFIPLATSLIALARGFRGPAILTGTFLLVFYLLTISTYIQGAEYGYNSRLITSVLFLIYAAVLFLFSTSRFSVAQIITFPAGVISYCVLVGYVAGIGVYGEYFLMALYTAVLHILIAVSILSLFPERGVMAPIHASFVGGHIVRLILPVMIASITVLGLLTLKMRYHVFPGFGEVFLMGMTVSIIIVSVIIVAAELNRIDLKRKTYRRDLRRTQRFFRDVLENLAEAVAVFDAEGNILYQNTAMKRLGVVDFPEYSGERRPVIIDRTDPKGRHYTGWMVPRFQGDEYAGFIVSLTDITDLILAKRSLEDTLMERDALLAEVHHRVKNNLQIIISLLNIQAMNADDDTRRILMDTQSRVRAMAIIHETLYDSGDFSGVLMDSFITRLMERLITVHSAHGVHFRVDADVRLNLETAIPLALFINEALTNSIRHAFPEGEGMIDVRITSNDHLHLTVADDGVGIENPPSGTVGISLMRALADQLDGEFELISDNGTVVSLHFRELEYKSRF
ncbi:hypothetical protein FVF72_00570 [Methanothermobacter sp. KEPCO-1]|uniref:sensor histidine kinase n=1 Tax=Methanothermobacter sp. KEPCO-1 TaxID=2603820 RepID=UPI0011CA82DA|nr:sensor histidine kinase [Methanothermobacter sp. KEPCO-1]QEF93782.1 hypothetical protein FVF72_00570 [Methanothermobacter sp. KEPCO-1]